MVISSLPWKNIESQDMNCIVEVAFTQSAPRPKKDVKLGWKEKRSHNTMEFHIFG